MLSCLLPGAFRWCQLPGSTVAIAEGPLCLLAMVLRVLAPSLRNILITGVFELVFGAVEARHWSS